MLQLKQKSADLLITRDNAKVFLRISNTKEDELIDLIIQTSQQYIEDYTSRAFTENTYNYVYDILNTNDCEPIDRVKIKIGKITEIVSIKTYDSDNTETIHEINDFVIQNFNQYSYIIQKDSEEFPLGNRAYTPLIIEFKAGYKLITDVPFDLQQACYKLIANYYEYKESFAPENMTEIPHSVTNILNKWRIEQM